ncbi:hypothetical protein F5Y16DRAFT_410496 [Xylariaceae sp. FL0255]|nr:hypothetical protein F5Y16DRAFT_410496 [Xylariaceae sp. FL0255]
MLEAELQRSTGSRRARPPDLISIGNDPGRTALRTDKSMKRESKLGLRGMFNRSKLGKNERSFEESQSFRITQRPAGVRNSLLGDFGNWPPRLHSSRSEASLISTTTTDLCQTGSDILSPPRSRQGSSGTDKSCTGTWDAPPLFQVYPQAVKHATLPACTTPLEALARLSEPRVAKRLQRTSVANASKTDQYSDNLNDGKSGSSKKKSLGVGRKSIPEWTEKIFVLVTSGHLLQYAAEGSFNRLPEKVLQLTRSSAAYASDLIPGKHWVLQVVSSTETDATNLSDPKSFRSKLSMKGYEKKQVASMLLVYESPEAMDNWLAVLRLEIEALGGKKKLSETGGPESTTDRVEPRAQNYQRAAIVRDPDRFSRVITRDFSYIQKNALLDPTENDFSFGPSRRLSAYTDHNSSPTASVVSSDGQHLDNLRDSSSSHRFSYVSSGQRTIVTSAGSSPACSPTRENFSSQLGDDQQGTPTAPEIRLRPNAAAIVNRRQSMQTLISTFEAPPPEAGPRQYSKAPSLLNIDHERPPPALGIPTVRNFSVPSTGKRFSLSGTLPNSSSPPAYRKSPPTALSMARPLSIVIDQPSPRSPRSPNSLSRSWESRQSLGKEFRDQFIVRSDSPEKQSNDLTASLQQPFDMDEGLAPRTDGAPTGNAGFVCAVTAVVVEAKHQPRAASALGAYSVQQELPVIHSAYKRSTILGTSRSTQNMRHPLANMTDGWRIGLGDAPRLESPSSSTSSPPNSSHIQASELLTVASKARSLAFRRSMPQLVEGPPPAPPPSYALPPIPPPRAANSRFEI